jgi:hypothetical protein
LPLADATFAPTLSYIAERWPLLPPHIREAILTLVDCGANENGEQGGAQ